MGYLLRKSAKRRDCVCCRQQSLRGIVVQAPGSLDDSITSNIVLQNVVFLLLEFSPVLVQFSWLFFNSLFLGMEHLLCATVC